MPIIYFCSRFIEYFGDDKVLKTFLAQVLSNMIMFKYVICFQHWTIFLVANQLKSKTQLYKYLKCPT